MGISITGFVDGSVMSSATTMSNFTTVRDWMNGGLVTGDLNTGAIQTRHFRKLEHYTKPNPRTTGVTGTTLRGAVSDDRVERVYLTCDSHGAGVWSDVGVLDHRFYVPDSDTGQVEAVWEWWSWSAQSALTTIETGIRVTYRLSFNGSEVAATYRNLWDSGYDATAQDSGPFIYPARNHQAIFTASTISGWNQVKLQAKVTDLTTAARANFTLIIIGARQKHLEFWRNP